MSMDSLICTVTGPLKGEFVCHVSPPEGTPSWATRNRLIAEFECEVLGNQVQVRFVLNSHTGEIMVWHQDGMLGGFRLGDLLMHGLQAQMARAQMTKLAMEGQGHATH